MPADMTHVDEREALDALDPAVGAGSPQTAPAALYVDDEWAEHRERGWKPTKKWLVSRITALTGLGIAIVNSGSWDKEHTIFAITVVSAAALSWITNNEES